MERTVRTQRSLTKQDGIEEIDSSTSYENISTEMSAKPQLQSMGSSEEQPPGSASHRSRNKVKLLTRSHAVREETSPPPDPQPDQLKQENRKNKDWHPPLSRGNSREQQFDSNSHSDLHHFFVDTMSRSSKDRLLLIRIENELINLANDSKRTMHKFPQMSSYQRMLVHRVAAYFNMEHNVDTSGNSVIVNTTKSTRIPEGRFRDFVREDLLLTEEPRRSILKRDSSSFDETGTFKFDGEGDVIDDLHWESEEVFTNCDLPTSNQRNGRLLKVESYESGDTLRANSLRPSVAKSHSFNGYEPQQQQAPAQSARILTKQDSGSSLSSRISPSSSGYKSQRSDATLSATPSPTATPNLHSQLSTQSTNCDLSPEPETVVWAVSDLSSVPPGSVLIHPQTGQPYTNPDGSIYHFDPTNPPRVVADTGSRASPQVASSQQISQSPAKHGEWKKKKQGKNKKKAIGGDGFDISSSIVTHPHIYLKTPKLNSDKFLDLNKNTVTNSFIVPRGPYLKPYPNSTIAERTNLEVTSNKFVSNESVHSNCSNIINCCKISDFNQVPTTNSLNLTEEFLPLFTYSPCYLGSPSVHNGYISPSSILPGPTSAFPLEKSPNPVNLPVPHPLTPPNNFQESYYKNNSRYFQGSPPLVSNSQGLPSIPSESTPSIFFVSPPSLLPTNNFQNSSNPPFPQDLNTVYTLVKDGTTYFFSSPPQL